MDIGTKKRVIIVEPARSEPAPSPQPSPQPATPSTSAAR